MILGYTLCQSMIGQSLITKFYMSTYTYMCKDTWTLEKYANIGHLIGISIIYGASEQWGLQNHCKVLMITALRMLSTPLVRLRRIHKRSPPH
jgi:hypothetical protein